MSENSQHNMCSSTYERIDFLSLKPQITLKFFSSEKGVTLPSVPEANQGKGAAFS